jgi:hypothetical protein
MKGIIDVGLIERQIDHERIARLAYAIYVSRDYADGHAEADWFTAEAAYAARPRLTFVPGQYGASGSLSDRIRSAHP